MYLLPRLLLCRETNDPNRTLSGCFLVNTDKLYKIGCSGFKKKFKANVQEMSKYVRISSIYLMKISVQLYLDIFIIHVTKFMQITSYFSSAFF